MALDFSSVTAVVSDVAPYAVSAIVAVVAANAAVEACKWAYSEVMHMLGREGYGDDNGGWVQDGNGNWYHPDDN